MNESLNRDIEEQLKGNRNRNKQPLIRKENIEPIRGEFKQRLRPKVEALQTTQVIDRLISSQPKKNSKNLCPKTNNQQAINQHKNLLRNINKNKKLQNDMNAKQ